MARTANFCGVNAIQEGWLSGLKLRFTKPPWRLTSPGVRIPPLPPLEIFGFGFPIFDWELTEAAVDFTDMAQKVGQGFAIGTRCAAPPAHPTMQE